MSPTLIGVVVVVLVWLLLLTIGLFWVGQIAYVLAKQELVRCEGAEQARKMLRWGLEQRRTGGSQNTAQTTEGAQDGRADAK